jgi:NADH-quinone oxidoreductase subunit L
MVARLSFLYVQAPGVLCVIAIVGTLTAVWAALIATSQTDIKKVLAYSTVSQLGFMFLGVGVGAFFAGTLHLITHAFFKACLFLGSGAVIHGLHGEQEMTKMGGLKKYMPHTAKTFLIATIAITGVLPLSGFFSKDEILAQALHTKAFSFLTLTPNGSVTLGFVGPLLYLVGTLTAMLTSYYMFRCYLMTFEGTFRGGPDVHPHESPPVMTGPLWVLAFLSIVALVLGLPEGFAHNLHLEGLTWEHFTSRLFATPRGGGPEAAGTGALLLTYFVALVVAWIGAGIAWAYYGPAAAGRAERFAERWPRLHRALVNKLYVDELYDFLIVRPLWRLARGTWAIVDKTIIDGLFVNGTGELVRWVGAMARRFQNGDVQRYAAVTALGVALLVAAFLLRG